MGCALSLFVPFCNVVERPNSPHRPNLRICPSLISGPRHIAHLLGLCDGHCANHDPIPCHDHHVPIARDLIIEVVSVFDVHFRSRGLYSGLHSYATYLGGVRDLSLIERLVGWSSFLMRETGGCDRAKSSIASEKKTTGPNATCKNMLLHIFHKSEQMTWMNVRGLPVHCLRGNLRDVSFSASPSVCFIAADTCPTLGIPQGVNEVCCEVHVVQVQLDVALAWRLHCWVAEFLCSSSCLVWSPRALPQVCNPPVCKPVPGRQVMHVRASGTSLLIGLEECVVLQLVRAWAHRSSCTQHC